MKKIIKICIVFFVLFFSFNNIAEKTSGKNNSEMNSKYTHLNFAQYAKFVGTFFGLEWIRIERFRFSFYFLFKCFNFWACVRNQVNANKVSQLIIFSGTSNAWPRTHNIHDEVKLRVESLAQLRWKKVKSWKLYHIFQHENICCWWEESQNFSFFIWFSRQHCSSAALKYVCRCRAFWSKR